MLPASLPGLAAQYCYDDETFVNPNVDKRYAAYIESQQPGGKPSDSNPEAHEPVLSIALKNDQSNDAPNIQMIMH